MGEPDHPFQIEAFNIFKAAWLDLQHGEQLTLPPSMDQIIEQAADKLAAATAAKPVTESAVFLYSILSAIVDQASQSPASLDLMLQTYVHAAKKLPTHISSDYGKGLEGAMGHLHWWIAEEADGFNPPLPTLHNDPAGKTSAEDWSSPQFREADVKARLEDVLDHAEEWRRVRVRCTLMSAARGRCYALNLVRGTTGRTIIAHMDAALDIQKRRWSEAQFIGAAVLLRACARSLTADAHGTTSPIVSRWVQKLEALLWGERVGFAIKSHSELLLKNLRDGPSDETSEQLFQPKHWLF